MTVESHNNFYFQSNSSLVLVELEWLSVAKHYCALIHVTMVLVHLAVHTVHIEVQGSVVLRLRDLLIELLLHGHVASELLLLMIGHLQALRHDLLLEVVLVRDALLGVHAKVDSQIVCLSTRLLDLVFLWGFDC